MPRCATQLPYLAKCWKSSWRWIARSNLMRLKGRDDKASSKCSEDLAYPITQAVSFLVLRARFPKSLKQILKDRDLAGVDKEFERALANIDKDPPAAITAACSILESLFKVYIKDNKDTECPATRV